jgi:hypothetical protein
VELNAFVHPSGQGTTPNPARVAKLEQLLKRINPNAPSVMDVINFERHQGVRDRLLAALKANP